MDLTVSDFLEHFLDDDPVRVLACYVEGFKPLDGERFVDLARRLRAQGERVIAFKAGKTAAGAPRRRRATPRPWRATTRWPRALMEDAGVVVAADPRHVRGLRRRSSRCSSTGCPRGRRLGVLSNAGFECSSVLDKLYALEPGRPLGAPLGRGCARACPGIAHADNPVDATPMADTRQFVAAAAAMLDDPGVDALLVSPIPVTPALDNLAPDLAGVHCGEHLRRGLAAAGAPPPLPADAEAGGRLRGLGPPLRRLRHGAPARRHPGLSEDRPRLAGPVGPLYGWKHERSRSDPEPTVPAGVHTLPGPSGAEEGRAALHECRKGRLKTWKSTRATTPPVTM